MTTIGKGLFKNIFKKVSAYAAAVFAGFEVSEMLNEGEPEQLKEIEYFNKNNKNLSYNNDNSEKYFWLAGVMAIPVVFLVLREIYKTKFVKRQNIEV